MKMIKNVLVRRADGREMVYPAEAVKVNQRGGLYVVVSLISLMACELIEYKEAL